jgi:hypothetical protein
MIPLPDKAEVLHVKTGIREAFYRRLRRVMVWKDAYDCFRVIHIGSSPMRSFIGPAST